MSGQRVRGDGLVLWTFGAWFAATVGMSYVAGANFGNLDPERLARSAEVFGAIPEGEERTLALRYVASELNRTYFSVYGYAQVALCVLAAIGTFLAAHRGRALQIVTALCVLLALVMTFHITPAIVEFGRTMDLVPRDPPPPGTEDFAALHDGAVGIETVKLLLLLAGSVLCLRRVPASAEN